VLSLPLPDFLAYRGPSAVKRRTSPTDQPARRRRAKDSSSGGAFIRNVAFPGGGIGQFDVFYPSGSESVIGYQNVELTQPNAS
jgi:hypothetical protein